MMDQYSQKKIIILGASELQVPAILAAKKRGIKPIIGCEVYVAARSMTDKIHSLDKERSHLILLFN